MIALHYEHLRDWVLFVFNLDYSDRYCEFDFVVNCFSLEFEWLHQIVDVDLSVPIWFVPLKQYQLWCSRYSNILPNQLKASILLILVLMPIGSITWVTTYLACVFVCFYMSEEQWWVILQTCNDCGNDRISLWTSKGLSSYYLKPNLKKFMLYDLFIEILRRISIIIWLWMMSTNIKKQLSLSEDLILFDDWFVIWHLVHISVSIIYYLLTVSLVSEKWF